MGNFVPAATAARSAVRLRRGVAGIIAAQGMVREICVGLPVEVVNNATLVAGVLVTDSMGQTRGEGPWLEVDLGRHAVTLRVEDTSTALPVLGSDGRIAGGYDLDIIGRLVETWGFSRTSTGRQVWALLTDPATAAERTGGMAQARPARGKWPDLPPGTSRTPRRAVMNGSHHPVAVDARPATPAVPAERLVGLCDSVIGHMLVAGLTLSGPAAPPEDRTRLLRAGAALDAALRELRECTGLLPNLEPDATPAPRARTVPEPQRAAASRRSLSLASDAWRC